MGRTSILRDKPVVIEELSPQQKTVPLNTEDQGKNIMFKAQNMKKPFIENNIAEVF